MSKIQKAGEALFQQHGFLGVPVANFDEGGRRQFMTLLREGLAPESKVLEIGCGCLRVGYWLIQLLERDGYCGIEPFRERVQWGCDSLLPQGTVEAKRPRFDYNDTFDTSVFGDRFDYFLAGSIWTHCSKAHIETMLDGFLANSRPDAIFLASVLLAADESEDYKGDTWVGTSHQSSTSGIVRHLFPWIRRQCEARELVAERLPGHAFDGQIWLRIRRSGVPLRKDRIAEF